MGFWAFPRATRDGRMKFTPLPTYVCVPAPLVRERSALLDDGLAKKAYKTNAESMKIITDSVSM